jgi:hypothetical protein
LPLKIVILDSFEGFCCLFYANIAKTQGSEAKWGNAKTPKPAQVWWHMPVIPATWKADCKFQASLGKVRKTLSQKQNINKRTESVAQVVECLRSMRKALGSIPDNAKHSM